MGETYEIAKVSPEKLGFEIDLTSGSSLLIQKRYLKNKKTVPKIGDIVKLDHYRVNCICQIYLNGEPIYIEELAKTHFDKMLELYRKKTAKLKTPEYHESYLKRRSKWYKKAEGTKSTEDLANLTNMLTSFKHDYNTSAIAPAVAALAAAHLVGGKLGITGFQAGAVFWEFFREWNPFLCDKDSPAIIVIYQNMLYPQYEHKFTDKILDKGTWEWLQKKARELLDNQDDPHPDVKTHWQSIVDGIVPFGYTVKKD